MTELILPPSPNWYCSKATDCNSAGIFVYSSRQEIFTFDINNLPPTFLGYFHGHREKVSCVSLCQIDDTPHMCCSAADDGTLVVWDVKTFEAVHDHHLHSDKVTGLSWSPVDKNIIISGDESGTIVYWNLLTTPRCCLPEKTSLLCLACSTQQSTVAAVGYKHGLILLLDFKSGCKVLHRLRGHDEEIHSLAWSPIPGEVFNLSATEEDENAEEDATGNGSSPLPGCLLASGCKDKTVRIWSTSKGRQLQQLNMPKGYRRDRADEAGKSRLWITVYWSKKHPRKLLSTSQGNDLLLWNLENEKLKHQVCGGSKYHSRMLFNICGGGKDDDTICTTSMDRLIMFWKFSSMKSVCALPTCGGFVYTAKSSPVDPGRLAIGVGDNMLRVWNLNSKSNPYDVNVLWQGIRSKVTALSWHPKKEGQVAYGTDNGRIGIYNVLSNKTPSISNTYHKRIVYCVAWGPPCGNTKADEEVYHLYSVGDGIILKHDPYDLQREAQDVNKLIQKTNDIKFKFPIRSEICWNPDLTILAIGNDDGSIHVHKAPDLKLICIIKVHQKLINTIQWHPIFTAASPMGSDCKHWIASGSNESVVCVTDLSSVLADRQSPDDEEEIIVSECMRRLEGHSNRITGLAWNPHVNGQLVSVSYDGLARVWDVNKKEIISTYNKHAGKLLCVVWSSLHPDEIFTGADDFSLHKWNISKHTDIVETKKKYKKKGKTKSKEGRADDNSSTNAVTVGEDSIGKPEVTQTEILDLQKLLEDKKKELMGVSDSAEIMSAKKLADDANGKTEEEEDQQDIFEKVKSVSSKNDVKRSQFEVDADFNLKTNVATNKDKKKRRAKSMFPISSKKENRGRSLVHEDLIVLTDLLFVNGTVVDEDYIHLGFFLNRKAVYRLLKLEGQNHLDNENMDYYLQMEIWKGNIGGAIKFAKEREELTDWLVSMAPLASHGLWLTICEEYARQLEMEGQYHKAATYFLACHKVYDAIELFKRHKLYKEAISLAKVRLSSMDPVFEDLYMVWAQQLMKDGNYEQAAKCQLAMLQVKEASNLLAKRYDLSSLQTAAHMSFHANEEQEGLIYAQKVINQNLLHHNWQESYGFIHKHHCLMSFLLVTNLHELLVKELCQMVPDIVQLADGGEFSNVKTKNTDDIHVPEFILDHTELDPVSPWQPHHINGHTFPHHVLKSWYTHHKFSFDKINTDEMYKMLNLLNGVRQSQVDIQQLIIQCSIDMTLCLLSLIRADTQQAITHLLQAVASVHGAKQFHLLEAICRLFLPLGPKYLLKLQQEVTAMKVVISVDTNTDLESSSKSQTTKRFMSELKDEGHIFNNGVRCRELDCLRAFYYLCVLHYLKKVLNSDYKSASSSDNICFGEKNSSDSHREKVAVIGMECDKHRNTGDICEAESVKISANLDSTSNGENNGISPQNNVTIDSTLTNCINEEEIVADDDTETTVVQSGQEKVASMSSVENDSNLDMAIPEESVGEITDEVNSTATANTMVSVDESDEFSTLKTDSEFDNRIPSISPLSVDKLKKISQGVLWNIQAKQFALTETLGYIHKAISQLLLSQNSGTKGDTQKKRLGNEKEQMVGNAAAAAETSAHDDSHHHHHHHNHHPHTNGAYLETCNVKSRQTLHLVYTNENSMGRGRKVFWQDEPYRTGSATHIPNILSPNKYINMPDEWYDLPVEEKYSMPYITLPVLKEEEEYVMHELKKSPDISQVPFPNPQECVFLLVEIARKSRDIGTEERNQFICDVVHWSLNYAVSSNQQQVLHSLWHPQ